MEKGKASARMLELACASRKRSESKQMESAFLLLDGDGKARGQFLIVQVILHFHNRDQLHALHIRQPSKKEFFSCVAAGWKEIKGVKRLGPVYQGAAQNCSIKELLSAST